MSVILYILDSIDYVPQRYLFESLSVRLRNRLRVARAELRLSQEELARKARVSRQTISAIENYQYVPSAELAFVVAEQLGMPVTAVFYLEGDRNERA
jgi:putative transcriptional regulator